MSLSDHITELEIQSSLESITDRFAVSLFFAPTDPEFSSLPAIDSEFTATITINYAATLSILGVVKEREFSKSDEGYNVTLHLYDIGIYLLDANIDAKYKRTIIPESGCDTPQITNTVDILNDVKEIIDQKAGRAIAVSWEFPHYNIMMPLILRSSVAGVLQSMSSYFSLSEIRKVVLYADDTGKIVSKQLDLWESRLSGAIDLGDKHVENLVIGETELPVVRKARLTGGAKHKIVWSTSQPEYVSQLSSDNYGRKTDVLTLTLFDSLGRVSSVVIETSVEDVASWGRLLVTRESTDYVYDPCSGRILNETMITTQWSYSGALTEAPTATSWDQFVSFTEYKYMDTKYAEDDEIATTRLSSQIVTTEERKIGNVLTKTTREVTSYIELAKGLTQRRTEFWQRGPLGFAIDPLKLVSSSASVYYGDPPSPPESPPTPAKKDHLSKRNELITAGSVGTFFEFDNPHIIDEDGITGPFGKGAFATLIKQLKELSGATRLDVSCTIIGFPFIRKGDVIKVEDTRKARVLGDPVEKIKAVVMEVNHSVVIGSKYITSIRAVSYQ